MTERTSIANGGQVTDRSVSTFEAVGLVPVVVLDKASHAVPLALALQRGGLPIAEVTFRTAAAADAIRAIAAEVPTGGIGMRNLESCLSPPAVVACGGSWMVDPPLVAAEDFGAVERLSRETVDLAARIRRAKAVA